MHYILILQEVNGSLHMLGPSEDTRFSVNSSYIKEDSEYTYRVRAVNNNNISSETEEMKFCES